MTASVPPIAKPALSASLKVFFRALSRGIPPRTGTIELRQHGGRDYSSGASVSTDEHAPPEGVIGILEKSASPWGVCLAVRHVAGGLFGVPVLAVRMDFPLSYFNPAAPESESGKQWCFPEMDIKSWETSLEDWPAPPTMIVRALPVVCALWALADPLPARTTEDQAAALDLLRAVARAAGAEPPPALADVEVPLVGTRCVNQDLRVASCVRLDEGRVYEASAIEAAVRAAKE